MTQFYDEYYDCLWSSNSIRYQFECINDQNITTCSQLNDLYMFSAGCLCKSYALLFYDNDNYNITNDWQIWIENQIDYNDDDFNKYQQLKNKLNCNIDLKCQFRNGTGFVINVYDNKDDNNSGVYLTLIHIAAGVIGVYAFCCILCSIHTKCRKSYSF